MVSILYAVTAFVCALVLILLPLRMRRNLNKENQLDKAFLFLINWTAAFCLIDGAWGVLASGLIRNSTLLFGFSTVFHVCAAFTPLVWLNYVLVYLGGTKYQRVYRIVFGLIFLAQIVLLAVNISNHMMFRVDEAGVYRSTPVRRLLFYLQYITYVLITVFSTAKYLNSRKKKDPASGRAGGISGNNYLYVILFVAAPVLTGIFQMIYPDAPAYSIGYMLGCCIIYSFAVTELLNERMMDKVMAQASSRAKTEFLFNMSHDIRTPMNAITGFIDKAIRHKDEPRVLEDSLEKAKLSGEYLLKLINDILDMARIESGKLELKEQLNDVEDGNKIIRDMFGAEAAAKGIDLRVSVRVSDRYLWFDGNRMLQIVANLLSNAVKYTNPGGQVLYSVEQVPCEREGYGRFIITVEDTGIGMSPEFLQKIFNAFERDPSAIRNGAQGTGLGMAIVKKLTDAMGCGIDIRSGPGKGTAVTVTATHRIATKEETERFRAGHDEKDAAVQADFSGRRALLVEDNELNREIALEILQEEGLLVGKAEDGAEAVRMLKEKGPGYYDFVLMDIQMPVMNGYEATKAIRKMYPDRHIPIIALSANAFAEDKAAAIASGMDDHVAKPINVKELFAVLARFL